MTPTASKNWQTYCDACADYVATDHAGACAWCGGKAYARSKPRVAKPWLMGDDIIEAAIAAYATGHSVPAISRAFLARTGYATAESMASCLYTEFEKRGVKRRTRSGARGLANRRRSQFRKDGVDTPGTQCIAQNHRGQRCRRDAKRGDVHCHAHMEGGSLHVSRLRTEAFRTGPRLIDYAERVALWCREGGRDGVASAVRVSGASQSLIRSLIHVHEGRVADRGITRANVERLEALLATRPTQSRRAAA